MTAVRLTSPRATVSSAAIRTSVGVVRSRNEDAGFVDRRHRFFVVADGMGGHSAGDVASALAVETVRASLEGARELLGELAGSSELEARVTQVLEGAVRAANNAIFELARRHRDMRGMGTTLLVAIVIGDQAFVAHAGDSRAYLVRGGAAKQETVDHTMAQAMVEAGTLSSVDAEESPMRSVLCNAIGIGERYRLDQVRIALLPGDRLLLCTDGLYDYFEPVELARRITAGAGDAALDGLIHEACARGGHDNATGILIEMAAAPRPHLRAPSPLAGVPDANLSAIVEHVLRETSEPIPVTITLEY